MTITYTLQMREGPTARILGVSGGWYAADEFGPLRRKPRTWKTEAGAKAAATALGRPEAVVVRLLNGVATPQKTVKCDGTCWGACSGGVTHIDEKGYAYCAAHGEHRRTTGIRCWRLRAWELRILEVGGTLPSYTPGRQRRLR